jgi:hypothetical protein
MQEWRPAAFNQGHKDNCRSCGEPISWIADSEQRWPKKYLRGMWIHTNTDLTQQDTETDPRYRSDWGPYKQEQNQYGHHAQPRSFCTEYTTDGTAYDICGRPIKYEDIMADNLSCGIHMKQVLAAKAQRERERVARERRDREKAIEEFMKAQYSDAAQRLRDAGHGGMVEGWRSDKYYFHKEISVDLFELAELLAPRKEEDHAEDESGDADPSIFDS